MASFATPSDLATQLKHDVDTEAALQLLDMISAEIRSAAGQTISRVVDDTVTLRVDPRCGELVLPQRPADAPTALTVNGYYGGTVAPAGWWFNGIDTVSLNYIGGGSWYAPGPEYGYRGSTWGLYGRTVTVTVTYSHGSDDATWLSLARSVTLAAAERAFDNEAGVRSESIDDYSRTLAGPIVTALGASLTGGERALVRQHYGRRIGSVAVR